MTTANKIIGSVTVSAPFHREGQRYDADVVFDLHEDGQRSLRSQEVVRDGLYIDTAQDFEQEAYALMHAWDTRELEIEVAELKRGNAALRERLERLREAVVDALPLADWALMEQSPPCADQEIVDAMRAALAIDKNGDAA